YTAYAYWRRRGRYIGGTILSSGFGLWGVHLLLFPLADRSAHTTTFAYLASAIIAIMIIVGMVTENETNTSENNYRELFDLARDAIFLLDPRTLQIVEANLAATVLLGRSCTELINQPISRFLPDLRSDADAAALLHKVNAPLAELTIPLSDGSTLTAEARANLTTCPRGEVIQLTVRDITLYKHVEQSLRETAQKLERTLEELRRTQQQLVQQERLRALEQMASGVAHDFNNALAKIIGFNELLLAWPENLADKDKVKKFLQMSTAAARDAVQIVNRLREFYRHRKTTDVYQAVDLHQVIEQAIVLTQPRWKDQMLAAGVTIRIELDLQEVPAVHGSATDLREALINVLFNAVDALPHGGVITVGTRHHGDVVELFVRDNGVGMTEEVRQRCLEPFFSTKDKRGTGLGLAIVYGVVHRHGGTIEIESAPEQGTTVRIRLPTQTGIAAPLPPTYDVPPLRVLVVEDDPVVLDLEAQFLRHDRHHVETATTGRVAWEKFQQHRFDLVIADRALPEWTGDQLAAAVKRTRPDVGVVIVTGFADGRETAADVVLAKPITHESLRQAVQDVYRRFLAKEQAA
ncbi:MAG: ATP-binding protein, partial [Verrucomicrobiae bacterium]|nr:ATP-binding protein [Verrucomicrobiae bacterium]